MSVSLSLPLSVSLSLSLSQSLSLSLSLFTYISLPHNHIFCLFVFLSLRLCLSMSIFTCISSSLGASSSLEDPKQDTPLSGEGCPNLSVFLSLCYSFFEQLCMSVSLSVLAKQSTSSLFLSCFYCMYLYLIIPWCQLFSRRSKARNSFERRGMPGELRSDLWRRWSGWAGSDQSGRTGRFFVPQRFPEFGESLIEKRRNS